MKCSICIATVPEKAGIFGLVLDSIFDQKHDFDAEVIVAHDGEPKSLDPRAINIVVRTSGEYRNPAVARNAAMRRATGDVLVLQSDDVIHDRDNVLSGLVKKLTPGTFHLAKVLNSDWKQYVSPKRRRPFFFLGSVMRSDVFAIGGNSEDFTEPGYDDRWFGECLMNGRGLVPVYRDDVVGIHMDHPRPDLTGPYKRMKAVYERKVAEARVDPAKWIGGPAWPC